MSVELISVTKEEQDRNGTDECLAIEVEEEDLVRSAIVIYGGGANTEHFGSAIDALGVDHDVHIVEIRKPNRPFPLARLHLVNTPEGQQRVEELYESDEGVHTAYGSLVPSMHVDFLTKQLEYIGDGKLDFVVVSKPAVEDSKQMREVRAAKRAAEEKLRLRFGPEYVAEHPTVFVHEHYLEKGAVVALNEQLGRAAERLGRPSRVDMYIEEARTAEAEGRVRAFGGGFLDLHAHLLSMGLGIQSAINTTGRWEIPDTSLSSVERFRYEGSELPEDVETGFIIDGNSTIIDTENGGTEYDLPFTWSGGKGLKDRKEIVIEFVQPDTGEVSVIRADLRNNILEVPESVSDLFPRTEFDDNGYGPSVKFGLDGLNGGNPRTSFQEWDVAERVVKWGEALARIGQAEPPHVYPKDKIGKTSLRELSQASA